MKTTITGTIKSIGETNQITPKFSKRELVIETTGDYPQKYGCELTQDRCSLADILQVGETIIAECNVKGREWISRDGTPKYFISLDVWKITKGTGATPEPDGITKNFQEDAIKDMTPDSDLPF